MTGERQAISARARLALVLSVACAATLGLAATGSHAHACAGCRNPNLPLGRVGGATVAPGEIKTTLGASVTSVHVVHSAGCDDPATCVEIPIESPHRHDQTLLPGELRLSGEYGLLNWLTVDLQVPFRIVRSRIRYTDSDGGPFVPQAPDLHHRNETITGFGDPWLLARLAAPAGRLRLAGHAGVTLPFGRTQEDPFALGRAGIQHQHIQMGNGTVDPVAGASVSAPAGRTRIEGYVEAQITTYPSDRGFRAGNRYLAGAQVAAPLWPRLRGAVGIDLLHERPERWNGKLQEDGNLGRTELLLGATLIHQLGGTMVAWSIRVPVFRKIVSVTDDALAYSSPVILSVTVSRVFMVGEIPYSLGR